MGMSIDESIGWIKKGILDMRRAELCISDRLALETAIDTMHKYQKLQADYENRLKADMVAMLTELQMEIEELDTPNNGSAYMDCAEIIQQKINSLKENIE